MRMGILVVIHTFGADMKWHPHIHLIVTGGGLSLDGKRWIQTDPRFLMHHGGLKKRWKKQYVSQCRIALNQPEPDDTDANTRQSWAERQAELTGIDPLLCPNCDQPLTFVGMLLGNWQKLQDIFDTAGKDASIAPPLLKPG